MKLDDGKFGTGETSGISIYCDTGGSPLRIRYRISGQEVEKKEYVKAVAADRTLPPVYKNIQDYKKYYTDEAKGIIEEFKNVPSVKIPLKFDSFSNPLSKDGKPVILPDLSKGIGR